MSTACTPAVSAFDNLARVYDAQWTHSPIGRAQRDTFWHHAGGLFSPGQKVLDLGCGTGEDALRLAALGVRHLAIDSSPGMVTAAQARGVNARVLGIEDVGELRGSFDGAISNFGALNCVKRLPDLREPLARLVRRDGFLALCLMGRFCLWETLWYAAWGDFGKSVRRWGGEAATSLGIPVFYPTVGEVTAAFTPEFRLVKSAGIGICVPPSWVSGLSAASIERLARVNSRIGSWPIFRALSDHRLLVFRRL